MLRMLLLAATTLALFSTPAFATATLDLRLADGWYDYDDDVNDIETYDPFGIDARARFEFNPYVFARGEYLDTKADELEFNGDDLEDIDIGTTIVRGGIGLQSTTRVRFFGVLEFIEVELEIEDEAVKDDGVMLSGGIRDSGTGHFLWNVELGLMKLDDTDGALLDATLGYRFNPTWAVFGGVQSYALEDESSNGNDVELSIGHFTIGGSVSF